MTVQREKRKRERFFYLCITHSTKTPTKKKSTCILFPPFQKNEPKRPSNPILLVWPFARPPTRLFSPSGWCSGHTQSLSFLLLSQPQQQRVRRPSFLPSCLFLENKAKCGPSHPFAKASSACAALSLCTHLKRRGRVSDPKAHQPPDPPQPTHPHPCSITAAKSNRPQRNEEKRRCGRRKGLRLGTSLAPPPGSIPHSFNPLVCACCVCARLRESLSFLLFPKET